MHIYSGGEVICCDIRLFVAALAAYDFITSRTYDRRARERAD